MKRFRVTYKKNQELRYTGNLDMQKIWERYLRRANLMVAYSQGFHPQARIQQACPLPLGFFGLNEQVDFFLDDETATPADIEIKLETVPYPGIAIVQVEEVPLSEPALTTRVDNAEYRVEILDPLDPLDLSRRIETLLGYDQIIRSRRGKEYNLRPLIDLVSVAPKSSEESPILCLRLAARQGATGRPEEVISALGLDPFAARYIRTHLVLQDSHP